MSKHLIDLFNITKKFDGDAALDDVTLYIRDGEFLTLLGPSGCGKTTLLRIIAGFETPDEGKVLIDGKDLTDVPPHRRKVNTVFQKYALFPNMNVFQNVAFGLNVKHKSKDEIQAKVDAMLKLVDLKGYEKRSIEQLSGGQQQRVAIARALANEPEVLLLDEPLAALDLKLRREMQIELKNMQKQLGITFIFVTHDQEEALSMSDTIVVMRNGAIQQIGTPIDIYNEPENAFVADFIGESNILPGVMLEDFQVVFDGVQFTCVDKGFELNEEVDVVLRPEDVRLVQPEQGQLQGEVISEAFLGVHYEMQVETASGVVYLAHSTAKAEVGERVGIYLRPDEIHVMKKETEPIVRGQEEGGVAV